MDPHFLAVTNIDDMVVTIVPQVLYRPGYHSKKYMFGEETYAMVQGDKV